MAGDSIKTRDKGSLPFFLLLLLLPLILLGMLFAGVLVWNAAQKPIIRHRIMERCDELTAQAESDLAAANGYVWTSNMYIPESGDTIWYREAGFGLAPSSREYGYCYAADGDPHPYPGMEDYDVIPVPSGFRWEEPGGDNGCCMEPIAGNLYYYEVWF